jgi:UDP-N-acetylglucosamine 2-epimerase (non-hydrolysing)
MIKKIYILVGTRPNFIKVTRFKEFANKFNVEISIIHTGQHFDYSMADIFFKELNFFPDYFLNISPSNPTVQISEILLKLQDLIDKIGKPDVFMVPGDVNSTLAGAIFANKNNIKLAHLESGLRSFDRSMPEEHNRIVTDALSDLLFITEQSGIENLNKENNQGEHHFVGNTMIDTLVAFKEQINGSKIIETLNIKRKFCVVTIHRPSNVDNQEGLNKLLQLFQELSLNYDILFPVHPRTLKNIENFNLSNSFITIQGLNFLDPMGYFDFQKIISKSTFVLTDSGGIQEETTYLQIPCITLRENTERPVTCTIGSNTLVKFNNSDIMDLIHQIENGNYKKGEIPLFWEGSSTERILNIIASNE